MKNSTLQGFVSGVVSIAATIMVLQLTTPLEGDYHALIDQWQTLLAHFNSFFLIYIIWYYHTKEFAHVQNVTADVVVSVGLWMIFLALIPFATSWIEHFPDDTTPQAVYVALIFICIVTNTFTERLLKKDNPNITFSSEASKKETIPLYALLLLAFINSFLFPGLNVILIFGITVYVLYLTIKHSNQDYSLF